MEDLSDHQSEACQTHVEDLKDHMELQLPCGDLIFIAFRVEESGGRISFTLFDDLLLYLCHGSVHDQRIAHWAHCRFNSRSQLLYRLKHSPTDFIQLSPVQSPVESFAHIGAS